MNDKGQCNVNSWRNIVAVSAGENYTVALKSDGTLVATGDNEHGQCDFARKINLDIPKIQTKNGTKGVCAHCGGKLSLFGHKCKSCGKQN